MGPRHTTCSFTSYILGRLSWQFIRYQYFYFRQYNTDTYCWGYIYNIKCCSSLIVLQNFILLVFNSPIGANICTVWTIWNIFEFNSTSSHSKPSSKYIMPDGLRLNDVSIGVLVLPSTTWESLKLGCRYDICKLWFLKSMSGLALPTLKSNKSNIYVHLQKHLHLIDYINCKIHICFNKVHHNGYINYKLYCSV